MTTEGTAPAKRRVRADIVILAAGLAVVATVWGLSCWWSFAEQGRAATALGFEHPAVLPWMLDALAVALALIALASAVNGQAAGAARLGVLLALAGSVWANTRGVAIRSHDAPTGDAIAMAAIAPLSAYIALEVILGRIRRLVLWLRGEEAPAAVPALRLVRLLLAPSTFGEWRRAVLDRTAPTRPAVSTSGGAVAPGSAEDTATGQGARSPEAPAAHPETDAPAVGESTGREVAGPPAAPLARPEPGCTPSAPEAASLGAPRVHLTPVPSAPDHDLPGAPRVHSGAGRTSAASAPAGAPGRTRVHVPASALPRTDKELASALASARLSAPEGALTSGRAVAARLRIGQDRARKVLAILDGGDGGAA